jgi:hypothetical protein
MLHGNHASRDEHFSPLSDRDKDIMDTPYTREEIAELSPDAWPERGTYCEKCRTYIPRFAQVSPADEERLRCLTPVQAIKELRERTGCSMRWAKIWATHPQGPQTKHSREGVPPCPYCGKPLRTAKAQQCFECGADWHGESSRKA